MSRGREVIYVERRGCGCGSVLLVAIIFLVLVYLFGDSQVPKTASGLNSSQLAYRACTRRGNDSQECKVAMTLLRADDPADLPQLEKLAGEQ